MMSEDGHNNPGKWGLRTQGVHVSDMNSFMFLLEFQSRKATEHVIWETGSGKVVV